MRTYLIHLLFLQFVFISKVIGQYHRIDYDGDTWPSMVYKVALFPVQTKIECAILCQLDQGNCLGHFVKDEQCHLVDPGSSFSLISSPQTDSAFVFVDPGLFLASIVSNYTHLTNSIVDQWKSRIVETFPSPGQSSADVTQCLIRCRDFSQCNLFTLDSGLCQLGFGTIYNESTAAAAIPTQGIYVASGFVGPRGPFHLLDDSVIEWESHIYFQDSCDTLERCQLWCDLTSKPCEFITFHTITCYLGSVGHGFIPVDLTHVNQPIIPMVNLNGIASSMANMFEPSPSVAKYPNYLYKINSDSDFNKRCEFLCALEPNNACQFFIRFQDTCHFGRVSPTPSQPLGIDFGPFTSFAHLPSIANLSQSQFLKIRMVHHVWWHKIHTDFPTQKGNDFCAFLCLMSSGNKECNLFVYQNDMCYLGHSGTYMTRKTMDEVNELYVNAANIEFFSHALFSEKISSEWYRQMYRRVAMSYSDQRGRQECEMLCFLDDGPCYSYAIQDSLCYLGHPVFDYNLFGVSGETTLFEMEPKAHITHGGILASGSPLASSLTFLGKSGFSDFELPDLPEPIAGHGYTFGDNSLFSCGGYEASSGYTNACHEMKLNQYPHVWTQMPSLVTKKSDFPLIFQKGILYAPGGRTTVTSCTNIMETFTLGSSSWDSNSNLNLPPPARGAICTTVYNEVFYFFGGESDSGQPTTNVDVFDPKQGSWTNSGLALPVALKNIACGSIHIDSDTPNRIIIAGGEGPDGPSRLVFALDPPTKEWMSYDNLPGTISWLPFQNSLVSMNNVEVFLLFGYDGNSYVNDTYYLLNTGDSKFSSGNHLQGYLARGRPGVALVPLELMPSSETISFQWKIILRQHMPSVFPVDGWANNAHDIWSWTYSNLTNLEAYRCEGKIHFRLVYPSLGTFNEWYQTSNPALPSGSTVTGYEGHGVRLKSGFNGLRYNNDKALMLGDSSVANMWYWLGLIQPIQIQRLPGPPQVMVDSVLLYIKNDCLQ